MAQPQSSTADARPDERYPIRITADGRWFHEGSPIGRMALVRLFATALRRDASGDFWLETPAERGRIAVEDAPFIAVEVDREGDDLQFRTNVDDVVTLSPQHPLRLDEDGPDGPRAYVSVRPGLEAKLARSVFYHLVDMGEERDGHFGVVSGGAFFTLGRMT